MSEKKKSKTDVAARSGNKSAANTCRICGSPVQVVMAVSSTGKKKIKRICCEG